MHFDNAVDDLESNPLIISVSMGTKMPPPPPPPTCCSKEYNYNTRHNSQTKFHILPSNQKLLATKQQIQVINRESDNMEKLNSQAKHVNNRSGLLLHGEDTHPFESHYMINPFV